MDDVNARDVRNIVELLDDFARSGEGRMRLKMSEDMNTTNTTKQYHHGRCDVGSPWATGSLEPLDRTD